MQGMIGCYIKKKKTDRESYAVSNTILDNMLSVLENQKSSKIERSDFTNFSLAILYHHQTPYAFKPSHITANKKHTFIDGFIKDKQNVLADAKDKVLDPLFLTEFSGMYNIIYFNEANDELIIANDRHGARYLYYYDDDDCFIFAPNPKNILASGLVKNRGLDFQAIISLISHEYIMGDRSLAKSIKLFPFASYSKLNNNPLEIKKYWNFNSLEFDKNTSAYENLIEEGSVLVKNAVKAYAFDGEKTIIPLSGGLDSRTIACNLSDKAECQGLHIDYGFEKRYADKIAHTLNIDLEVYPRELFKPWQAIDQFILCSSQSIQQFWIFPFLKRIVKQSSGSMVVDGYLMNEVIGGLSTLRKENYSDLNRMYPPINKAFNFILGSKICKDYYRDHDSQVAEILSNCPSDLAYDKYLYFTILNYGRRFTLLFSVIHQYLCSVALPVLDYELMDFCLGLPFDAKVNSRLYRDIVLDSFPEMGRIPWSRNRLPLDSTKDRHMICKIKDKVDKLKYYISRITHAKIETLPNYNKNRQFRKDKKYREYFLNIIFDDQTFDKGYVSRKGVEHLVYLIDTGRNYFGFLEKIAIIELVSRQLDVN